MVAAAGSLDRDNLSRFEVQSDYINEPEEVMSHLQANGAGSPRHRAETPTFHDANRPLSPSTLLERSLCRLRHGVTITWKMSSTDEGDVSVVKTRSLIATAGSMIAVLVGLAAIHTTWVLPRVLEAARIQTAEMMDRRDSFLSRDIDRLEKKLDKVATRDSVATVQARLASLERRLLDIEKGK